MKQYILKLKKSLSSKNYKFVIISSFLLIIFNINAGDLIAQNYYYALENRNNENQIYTDAQFSANFSMPTPVEVFGELQVKGNKIIGNNGKSVQLYGMSLFWSQYIPQYWNAEAVKWLVKDWKVTLIRAPLAADYTGGYLEDPDKEMKKIKAVIEACIEQGIYVVVDFHSHHAHEYTDKAVIFFEEISKEYGSYPNVLFEPYNEPLPGTEWDRDIKPYLETVIKTIRKYSNNLIICGSENFSAGRGYAKIVDNPIIDSNVAYTLHFYAGSHYNNTPYLNSDLFLDAGFPLFATEYGTVEDTGDGFLDYEATKGWWEWMDNHQISSANWAISDAPETSAALIKNAPADGGWTTEEMTPSGIFVRNQIRNKYPLGAFETATIGTIKDNSVNLNTANAIYPKGWTVIATDTGITKTADGINIYSKLTVL